MTSPCHFVSACMTCLVARGSHFVKHRLINVDALLMRCACDVRQVLLYVLDGSSFDSTRTPAEDLRALLNELELYSKKLVKKPSLVFINKTDVEGE